MFLSNGTWVPDQPLSAAGSNTLPSMQSTSSQSAMREAVTPEINRQGYDPFASQQMAPNFNPNVAFAPQSLGMPSASSQSFNPAAMQLGSRMFNPNLLTFASQSPQPVNNPTQQLGQPMDQQSMASYQYQMPMQPNMGPQIVQRSAMQNVNNNNPQSVQNFLTALHQSNMSGSNAWQNGAGVQGQGPQAGFRGFDQNGAPYQANQWQNYNQGQQPQLGGYANQAQQGAPVMRGQLTQAPQMSGTGGVQGQAQYQRQAPPPSMNQSEQRLGTSQQGMSAASDVNSKQNIKGAESELQDFLNNLGVYSYEYKDPKYGEGRRISPMAQEIEKSDLGKTAISTNEEGYKVVDYGKLMGTQLAALALLNHKYNELESQLKNAVKEGLEKKFSKGK